MNILHVASEVAPWSQTGGLAEVVSSLPFAQAQLGAKTAVISPYYSSTQAALAKHGRTCKLFAETQVTLGEVATPVTVWKLSDSKFGTHYFVDSAQLFGRASFYGENGVDYPDNWLRFAVLSRVAVNLAPRFFTGDDIVFHAHDWQAGLVPGWAKAAGFRAIFTMHNVAFLGLFPKSVISSLGLSWADFHHRKFEFFDKVSFLKAGASAADVVTTVSPTYAREICEPGRPDGLDGFFRDDVKRLVGIINGIDTDEWNPENDARIAQEYSAKNLAGKTACRTALAHEFGFSASSPGMLLGMVTRLTEQKGADLVAEIIPKLYEVPCKLVVLGSGSPELESRFKWLAERFRENFAFASSFDPALAHRIFAGADAYLMPSRFEPCGLGQLFAMRYGCLPIVRPVGGLADTVTTAVHGQASDRKAQRGVGFWIAADNGASMVETLLDASSLFMHAQDAWMARVQSNMQVDFGWATSAAQTLALV